MGGESPFEQVEYPEGSDLIAFSSEEELDEVHEAELLEQFFPPGDIMAAMSKDHAKELTEALKGLSAAVQPGRTDKDLADALKWLTSAVKAEQVDKDPSFKLDHFQHGQTDPYVWWERLGKHADSKGSTPGKMFSLVVDDVTHAWYASVKENVSDADHKQAFLLEFGEEVDKGIKLTRQVQGR